MREVLLLLAPQWWAFRNRFRVPDYRHLGRALFALLLFGSIWGGSVYLLEKALSRLQAMDPAVGTILLLKGFALLLLVSFFLLLFSGLLTAISRFYLSQELPMLLSFPLSRGRIFAAKWVETLVSASWMVLLFGLPVFIAFGLRFQVSPWYYPWLLFVLFVFVPIPVGLGVVLTIPLMAVLPARRGKNLFLFLGFLVLGLLYLLFRIMRPERMINPEWFANLSIFLADMRAPTSIFLPSMWAVEAVAPFFRTGEGAPIFYTLLLGCTGAALMVVGYWCFGSLYAAGWLRAQERKKPFFTLSGRGFGRGLMVFRGLRRLRTGVGRALLEKDLYLFFRDEGQWSQFPMLVILVIVYLFSIKALPLEWGTLVGETIKYLVAYLNIAVVGIILAALASRFVFPSVSMEGRAFWLVRTSPVTLRSFLWNKFLLHFVPLLVLTLILMGFSVLFLHVKAWMVGMSMAAAVLFPVSLTGLAVGLGAAHADFETENVSQIQTGFRGTTFMLLALLLILMTVVLAAIPTVGMFLGEITQGRLIPRAKVIIGLFFGAAVLLNILFTYLPMRLGVRRLSQT